MKDILAEIDATLDSSLSSEYEARSTLADVQIPRTLNDVLDTVFLGGNGCRHLDEDVAVRLCASEATIDSIVLVEGSRDWWMAYSSSAHEERSAEERFYNEETGSIVAATRHHEGMTHDAFESWYMHPARSIGDAMMFGTDHVRANVMMVVRDAGRRSASPEYRLVVRWGLHVLSRMRRRLEPVPWVSWLYWYEETTDPLP